MCGTVADGSYIVVKWEERQQMDNMLLILHFGSYPDAQLHWEAMRNGVLQRKKSQPLLDSAFFACPA